MFSSLEITGGFSAATDCIFVSVVAFKNCWDQSWEGLFTFETHHRGIISEICNHILDLYDQSNSKTRAAWEGGSWDLSLLRNGGTGLEVG